MFNKRLKINWTAVGTLAALITAIASLLFANVAKTIGQRNWFDRR